MYGEDAWPGDRARVQGIVFIGGLAELVASWLTGEADLDTDQLAGVVADLFVSLSRRPTDSGVGVGDLAQASECRPQLTGLARTEVCHPLRLDLGFGHAGDLDGRALPVRR